MNFLVISIIAGFIHYAEVDCDKERTDDFVAMACNIYHEGRNQSIDGQKAVASVVINRKNSKRYPDSISEVIWQNKQFSWTHDGKHDRTIEIPAWKKAKKIASLFVPKQNRDLFCKESDSATRKMREYVEKEYGFQMKNNPISCEEHDVLLAVKAYTSGLIDNTRGSTHYHAKYVEPNWSKSMDVAAVIDDHIFYVHY